MDKKTLRVSEQDGKIVIKKKPQPASTISTILVLFGTAVCPFVFRQLWGNYLVIALYVLCVIADVIFAIQLFFGKIIINRYSKEIMIFNPIKHTKGFKEIEDIEVLTGKSSSVIFVCDNDKDYKLYTASGKQAEEIRELVKQYIPLNVEKEENKYEL